MFPSRHAATLSLSYTCHNSGTLCPESKFVFSTWFKCLWCKSTTGSVNLICFMKVCFSFHFSHYVRGSQRRTITAASMLMNSQPEIATRVRNTVGESKRTLCSPWNVHSCSALSTLCWHFPNVSNASKGSYSPKAAFVLVQEAIKVYWM